MKAKRRSLANPDTPYDTAVSSATAQETLDPGVSFEHPVPRHSPLSFKRFLELTPRRLVTSALDPAGEDAHSRRDLDAVVGSFAHGYNLALAVPSGGLDLSHVPAHLRGFAYEGAGMSRCLLDLLTLTRGRRLSGLLSGDGERYVHLVHVGAGWAFARTRLRPWRGVSVPESLLRYLAWDGWGFHQGYFDSSRVYVRHYIESTARGRVRPIRDQGAGRALWFYAAADPGRIAHVIAAFPPARRADLWAGVGLAASYTGAGRPGDVALLCDLAGGYRVHLAQGSAFAAKARVLAGEVPDRAASTITTITGVSPEVAAAWTDTALEVASRGGCGLEDYELWRAGVRRAWERQAGEVRS